MPGRGGAIDARHPLRRGARVRPKTDPKTFASERVRGGGRSRLPVTAPVSPGPLHGGQATGRRRPVGSGRSGMLRMLRGQTLGSDTFTLHDVDQHARPEGRAMRQPAGPVANSLECGRAREPRGFGVVRSTVPPLRPAGAGCRARLGRAGGARRDRTDDLMLAKHALYRLSYCPTRREGSMPAGPRRDWWAWEDSNFRPHAYQARALTN